MPALHSIRPTPVYSQYGPYSHPIPKTPWARLGKGDTFPIRRPSTPSFGVSFCAVLRQILTTPVATIYPSKLFKVTTEKLYKESLRAIKYATRSQDLVALSHTFHCLFVGLRVDYSDVLALVCHLDGQPWCCWCIEATCKDPLTLLI